MSDGEDEDARIDAQIAELKRKKAQNLLNKQKLEAIAAKEQAKVLVQASPAKKRSALDFTPSIKKDLKPIKLELSDCLRSQSLPGVDKPRPSTLAFALSSSRGSSSRSAPPAERTISFKQEPKKEQKQSDDEGEPADWKPSRRDEETLTVKEELVPGPREFGPDTEGLHEWRAVEPNSGIRLAERKLSHSLLQARLDSRYHLSPSQLYSLVRIGRDGRSYDIPVDGDWVTIAVVAERSEVRTTAGDASFNGKVTDDNEDVVQSDEDVKPQIDKHGRGKAVKRKFMSMTLCSMPPRTKVGDAGGDALLKLLLFEAEKTYKTSDGVKQHRGGSGGAFEKWCNLSVGSVIAILNPKVLRPHKGGSNPHPLTLPLAVQPTSADSVSLIGIAKDLGACRALRKDGQKCSAWIDTRFTNVCDYHLHTSLKQTRNGRSEFSNNTSTLTTATRSGPIGGRGPSRGPSQGKGEYDPSRKRGLLPKNNVQVAPRMTADGGGGATYIVGGDVVSTERKKSLHAVGEKFGRSTMSREKRKREEQKAEEELKRLLKSESGGSSMGAKYLRAARSSAREKEREEGKDRKKRRKPLSESETEEPDDKKRPFSVEAVRRIGFNPTIRGSAANVGESSEAAQKRIDSIMELQHHKPKLGRAPGAKVRSGVSAPVSAPKSAASHPIPSSDMVDLESDLE